MYEVLLQLPLFQGLCTDDFTRIIEKVKFHFRSYSGNEIIMNQGEVCNQLAFLLEGNLLLKRTDDKHGFRLIETISAPAIIEPYSLFGMYTYYESTYQAQEEVKLLVIDKSYILSELSNSKDAKIMLVSAYASFKAGANMQYKIPVGLDYIKGDNWETNEERLKKDWDAVYLQ